MKKKKGLNGLPRREFLAVMAGGFAALSFPSSAFKRPGQTIIPYLVQPEETVPGVANWYASTCAGCPADCGVLIKTREGRPIKLEGNPDHPLSHGGLCARGQATVLDLYDSARLQGPRIDGKEWTWDHVDATFTKALGKVRDRGGQIRIVSESTSSPTLLAAIGEFSNAFPTTRHVMFDPVSSSAILDAHRVTHGSRLLPWYRFERAKVVVGFDADFLGSWISPVEYTRGWTTGRRLDKKRKVLSWHAQFEARLSPTGANADLRIPVRPSAQLAAVCEISRRVAARLDKVPAAKLPSFRGSGLDAALLDEVADRLAKEPGRSLVVSGSNDLQVQLAVNVLNDLLGNYGETVDLERPSLQRAGDDAEMNRLIDEMKAGRIDAVLVLDGNPAYAHPRAEEFRQGMQKVRVTASLAGRLDETGALARFVCPDHDPFESWGDAHPRLGVYTMRQPVIAPLFKTRAATESLLTWSDRETWAYGFQRKVWYEKIFPLQTTYRSFARFWNAAVHDGVMSITAKVREPAAFQPGVQIRKPKSRVASGEYELDLYASVAIADGRQVNNPWLQELPDPISKVTWGNYASVSPDSAKQLGVVEGRLVEVTAGKRTVSLPAHVQPGMADGVVAVAVGYRSEMPEIAANYPIEKMFPIEREKAGGADVYPLLGSPSGRIAASGGMIPLAKTQTQNHSTVPFTGQDRAPARQTTLAAWKRDPRAGNPEGHKQEPLWPEHEYEGHHWGLAIDLNACTGCSACLIGCQAENNIPVVGKAEVRKSREMHWLRIDRYYSGTQEDPPKNPDVAFQPMMCQQCDNAPCETVCPVLATLHSSEGLNMQVYNRCVGTRYCANNCPYKTRRFNWFDYAHQDLVQNLVLNPDVTVRERGVMEKCTFCVQRIQETKITAKGEGRKPRDGEILPACAQSCPGEAIVFGDLNDPDSRVSKMAKDPRNYHVLDELATLPTVSYLTKVRNRKES